MIRLGERDLVPFFLGHAEAEVVSLYLLVGSAGLTFRASLDFGQQVAIVVKAVALPIDLAQPVGRIIQVVGRVAIDDLFQPVSNQINVILILLEINPL